MPFTHALDFRSYKLMINFIFSTPDLRRNVYTRLMNILFIIFLSLVVCGFVHLFKYRIITYINTLQFIRMCPAQKNIEFAKVRRRIRVKHLVVEHLSHYILVYLGLTFESLFWLQIMISHHCFFTYHLSL